MLFLKGRRHDHFDVFLSYTRRDTEGWTALIHSELKRQLALLQWTVFKDNADTQVGQLHWSRRLEKLVDNCRVFIIVIGEDWYSPQVKHLYDETNWVRREILRARAAENKLIIPLILNGREWPALSGIPPEIQPVIEQRNMCFFSGDSEKLIQEVQVLAQKITGTYAKTVSFDRRLDHAIAPLNRYAEIEHIFSAHREHNNRVFAFAGDHKDCYESFLHRCQAELGKSGLSGEAIAGMEIQRLEWRAFSDLPSASSQKNKLLDQVADSLSLAKDEKQIKKYFSNNSQAMVFYSVCDRPQSAQICIDWLNYWKTLLEKNNQRSAIAVLVFKRGWSFRRHLKTIHSSAELSERLLLTKGLGRIERAHVIDFHFRYLDDVPVDEFHTLIAKHYRWSSLAKLLPQLEPSCRKIRTLLTPYLLQKANHIQRHESKP